MNVGEVVRVKSLKKIVRDPEGVYNAQFTFDAAKGHDIVLLVLGQAKHADDFDAEKALNEAGWTFDDATESVDGKLCGSKYRGVSCINPAGHHLRASHPLCTDGRWMWTHPDTLIVSRAQLEVILQIANNGAKRCVCVGGGYFRRIARRLRLLLATPATQEDTP